MIPFFKSLLFDSSRFERFGRALIAGIGQLVAAGVIPTGISGGGKAIGAILTVLPFIIGAGQKNDEPKLNEPKLN